MLLTLEGIGKRFGQVRALEGASLALSPGRMVSIMGHNGAGKSTLMQVLAGTLAPDAGTIRLDGAQVAWSLRAARAAGVRTAFQELSLCPNLAVFENVRLEHRALRGLGWRRRARALARAALDGVFPGHGIDVDRPVSDLTLGERQMVEVARAFAETDVPVRLVILDEPTSSLDARAAGQLMEYTRTARGRGVTIAFISHRMPEVLGFSDDVVVMRDGRSVGGGPAAQFPEARLVEMMGEVREAQAIAPGPPPGPERVHDGSLVAHAGEVVGLAGLAGQGQREVLQRVFAGQGRRGAAAYVSGDRQGEGVFPLWSVGHNATVASLGRLSRAGWIAPAGERAMARDWRERLGIRVPDIDQPVTALSGGNQQKVLVARAFASDATTILLDDPLRGVDVGTKRDLYGRIRDEAAGGRCFLWYTTENAELAWCDRVYVYREGRVTEEIGRDALTEERVIRASFRDGAHA